MAATPDPEPEPEPPPRLILRLRISNGVVGGAMLFVLGPVLSVGAGFFYTNALVYALGSPYRDAPNPIPFVVAAALGSAAFVAGALMLALAREYEPAWRKTDNPGEPSRLWGPGDRSADTGTDDRPSS